MDHCSRARHLMDVSRHELAEKELRAALAGEPNDADAHALLASCLVRLERWEEALDEARATIGLAPDWAHAHYVLGWVYQQAGKWEAAREAYEEAIRLDPNDADHHAQLAFVLLCRNRWANAKYVAESGLKIDPQHVSCLNYLAWSHSMMGNQRGAVYLLETALRIDPENFQTHKNLGLILAQTNRRHGAIEPLYEALRLDPNDAGGADLLKDILEIRVLLRLLIPALLLAFWPAGVTLALIVQYPLLSLANLLLFVFTIACIKQFTSRAFGPRLFWIHRTLRLTNLSLIPRLLAWGKWELLLIIALAALTRIAPHAPGWIWFLPSLAPVLITGPLIRDARTAPRDRSLFRGYATAVTAIGVVGTTCLWLGAIRDGPGVTVEHVAGFAILTFYLYQATVLRMLHESGTALRKSAT